MGPSWYWPASQPRMPALVRELGLRAFPQANTGALMWEESATECIRYEGGAPADGSMRIHGGTAALIDSLAAEIPAERVLLGHRVTALRQMPQGISVEANAAAGPDIACEARIVICTLPPRLLAQTVEFDPPIPEAVRNRWTGVPTWMAGNAKFVAIYEHAFWRDAGLSGEGRSRVGPLVEIHDACDEHGLAALTAFIGTPPRRAEVTSTTCVTPPSLNWCGCSAMRPSTRWPVSSKTGLSTPWWRLLTTCSRCTPTRSTGDTHRRRASGPGVSFSVALRAPPPTVGIWRARSRQSRWRSPQRPRQGCTSSAQQAWRPPASATPATSAARRSVPPSRAPRR